MDKIVRYLLIMTLLYSVSSCIKDDAVECLPEYTVQVWVKDKNYANIGQIPQLKPMDENMPFDAFCKNIYYTLQDMSIGNYFMQSQLIPVIDDNQSYTIDFNNVPYGEYELVAWGNEDPNVPMGFLHNNETESTDLYMGSGMLTFTPQHQDKNIMLQRTKGELLILCNNFPSTITNIKQSVSSVYQKVNSHLEYSGVTNVNKTFASEAMLKTFLAPTVDGTKSKLNLEFTTTSTRAASSTLSMPEIDISLKRNEITMISVNYDDIVGTWEIWTYIDGEWTLAHNLNINDL